MMPTHNVPGVRPIEVLLVEDNPGDVVLIQESFKDARILVNLTVAEDGEEALRHLRTPTADGDSFRPDLIFLDLNLPKKNGFEVLSALRTDPAFDPIPVVIMTSSEAEQDILRGYQLHANAYITKPLDLEQFARVVRTTNDFWFSVVRFPQGGTYAAS